MKEWEEKFSQEQKLKEQEQLRKDQKFKEIEQEEMRKREILINQELEVSTSTLENFKIDKSSQN